jgi:RNA polymerase sigma-70 factor (ECF subfamily)
MTTELLKRLKRNDRKAQKEFYYKYAQQMFLLTYRYIDNELDAGSKVNMAFFRIFSHVNNFCYKGEKALLAWMSRIVINEALGFLRQKLVYTEISDMANVCNDSATNPVDSLMAETYYALIRELPAELRTVFNLYAIDGYTHKEIAGKLGIKESSSRVYLTRARRFLQKKIIQINSDDGTA